MDTRLPDMMKLRFAGVPEKHPQPEVYPSQAVFLFSSFPRLYSSIPPPPNTVSHIADERLLLITTGTGSAGGNGTVQGSWQHCPSDTEKWRKSERHTGVRAKAKGGTEEGPAFSHLRYHGVSAFNSAGLFGCKNRLNVYLSTQSVPFSTYRP